MRDEAVKVNIEDVPKIGAAEAVARVRGRVRRQAACAGYKGSLLINGEQLKGIVDGQTTMLTTLTSRQPKNEEWLTAVTRLHESRLLLAMVDARLLHIILQFQPVAVNNLRLN